MKLNYEFAGLLNISKTEIDVTDPCYDDSVFCRITRPIQPGRYNCYAGKGKNKWGLRVYALILLSAKIDFDKNNVKTIHDGTIGVDAGIAGFFENKPSYSDSEWTEICNYIFSPCNESKQFWIVNEDTPLKCNGFFSESGIGDGVYDLCKLIENGEIVGYKLEF